LDSDFYASSSFRVTNFPLGNHCSPRTRFRKSPETSNWTLCDPLSANIKRLNISK